MTEQQIRESISTILVKHNMPTRQIAITEIVNLFTQEREELEKKIDGMNKNSNDTFESFIEIRQEEILQNGIAEYYKIINYNQTLQDIKALLKEQ